MQQESNPLVGSGDAQGPRYTAPRAPEVQEMSRLSTAEARRNGPQPLNIAICPFEDAEIQACLGRKECSRLCCSAFCGPCQNAITMKRAGRPNSVAMGVGALQISANIAQTECLRSLGANGSAAVAASTAGSIGTPWWIMGGIACLASAGIASAVNEIHMERGGGSSCVAFATAFWIYPTCTTYQLSRKISRDEGGYI